MKYDVLVVGSGTAGIYFAKRMADEGYKVLVVDASKEEDVGKRLDIFHIDAELFDKYGVPTPKVGDEDYVSRFDYGYTRSAFNNYEKRTDYPFIVMHLPLFIKRLRVWAEAAGVEFRYDTAFSDFIYKEGQIVGAVLIGGGKEYEVESRLVADASGINSYPRTKLPDGYGVENFEIGPRDKFYVVLRYVKLKNPEKDRVAVSTGWAYYKTWIAPQADPDGAILGVGANISFEYAEKCYARFEKAIPLPEYELQSIQKGTTPYRRPPYSFVADGFLVLGDSACITKPYSGEGITAAWKLCAIAAEEAAVAMKDGAYPTQESLWNVNVRYVRTQGADFANTLATLVGAVDCAPEENDYEFKKGIVFNNKTMTKMNRNFNSDQTLGEMLSLGIKALGGVITGNIKIKTIKELLRSVGVAGKLKKHYKAFPSNISDFPSWTTKAEELWAGAGSMSDCLNDL